MEPRHMKLWVRNSPLLPHKLLLVDDGISPFRYVHTITAGLGFPILQIGKGRWQPIISEEI